MNEDAYVAASVVGDSLTIEPDGDAVAERHL